MANHDEIVQAFNNYLAEHETFESKGVKAAATRARKALGDLGKLTKERRKEIQEKKNAM
jgi:N-glycosylase/DNA lyase